MWRAVPHVRDEHAFVGSSEASSGGWSGLANAGTRNSTDETNWWVREELNL